MTALVLTLLIPACGGSSSSSSDDPEPKDPNPLEDTVIKVTYNEGLVWAGSQIYCIWIESNTDYRKSKNAIWLNRFISCLLAFKQKDCNGNSFALCRY